MGSNARARAVIEAVTDSLGGPGVLDSILTLAAQYSFVQYGVGTGAAGPTTQQLDVMQARDFVNGRSYFEFQGTYRIEDVRFDDRDQGFTAHIVRLRSEARLDTRLSSAALLQYSSAANSVTVNLRLRYNPREGTDLYLVWNEGLVMDRFSFEPARPLSDRRTILLKYSQTLTLGL